MALPHSHHWQQRMYPKHTCSLQPPSSTPCTATTNPSASRRERRLLCRLVNTPFFKTPRISHLTFSVLTCAVPDAGKLVSHPQIYFLYKAKRRHPFHPSCNWSPLKYHTICCEPKLTREKGLQLFHHERRLEIEQDPTPIMSAPDTKRQPYRYSS